MKLISRRKFTWGLACIIAGALAHITNEDMFVINGIVIGTGIVILSYAFKEERP